MKSIQFLKCGSIALLLSGFPLLRAAPGEFFVAADGNDAWSGRLAKATPDASDGPLASFAAAKATSTKAGCGFLLSFAGRGK